MVQDFEVHVDIPGVSSLVISQFRHTYMMQGQHSSHVQGRVHGHTRSPLFTSDLTTSATCAGVKYLSMPSPSSLVSGFAGQKRFLSWSSSHVGRSAKEAMAVDTSSQIVLTVLFRSNRQRFSLNTYWTYHILMAEKGHVYEEKELSQKR